MSSKGPKPLAHLSRRAPVSIEEFMKKWTVDSVANHAAEQSDRRRPKHKPPSHLKADKRLACKVTKFKLADLERDCAAVGLTYEPPVNWNELRNKKSHGTQYAQMLVVFTPASVELLQIKVSQAA